MKTFRSQLHHRFLTLQALCATVLLAGLLCGCGSKTYEERLETTKKYYDYIDRLNQNLGSQNDISGVSLRLPKQFMLIPAPPRRPKPKPPAGGDPAGETAEEEPRDPRQPDHLDIELPGLIAAWEANLDAVNGTGGSTQSAMLPGTIYLLSNHEYWRTFKTPKQTIDPTKFHEELMKTLEGALGVRVNERERGSEADRVNKWFIEVVPDAKDEQFAPKKEIRTITLVPESEQESESDNDFPREYQVYLFANGDMKIALIYALPRNVSTGEDLLDRIRFSLQTLNVSPDKPSGTRSKGKAPGGAPEIKPSAF